MKTLFPYLFLILLLGCKTVDTSPVEAYVVDADNLKNTVSYLASDELRGRNTGSDGIQQAARFLENNLSSFGIKPYFETFRDNFMVGELDAFNIVGLVEGSDPQLKNEFIVVGAHYDHIGVINPTENDSIANGANDNASGTATVLELARYFGKNKGNKRSIIFAFFSAEEKGLQGSKHLASKLKEEKISLYAMVNFEMTGVPFTDRDYTAMLTGYDMSNMADRFNVYSGSKLIGRSDVAVKYNLFKRSDNYAFYEEFGVPSQTISTCDLTNFDHYHKVGDEADIMNYNHMAKLTSSVIPVIEKMSQSDSKEIAINDN